MTKSKPKKGKKTKQTKLTSLTPKITLQKQTRQPRMINAFRDIGAEKGTQRTQENIHKETEENADFLKKRFVTLPMHDEAHHEIDGKAERHVEQTPSVQAISPFPPRFSQIQQSRNRIKEAFHAIKRDVLSIKEAQHQHTARMSELRQILKDSQTDYVTIDKFNLTKIRLSELTESIKKLQDHSLRLAQADDDRVKVAEFRDQTNGVMGKIDKLKFDLKELEEMMVSKEELQENLGNCRASIEDLHDQFVELVQKKDVLTPQQDQKLNAALTRHSVDVQTQLKEFKKSFDVYVTASQADQLLTDINAEFDGVKAELGKILDVQKEFRSFHASSEEVDTLRQQVTKTQEAVKTLVTKKQAENLLEDMNEEFEQVQNDFRLVHHEIQNGFKTLATKKELHETQNKWKASLQELRKMVGQDVSDIATTRKEFHRELNRHVTKDQLSAEIDDLHKELHEIADAVHKLYDCRKSAPDLADIDKRLTYHMMTTKEKYVERDKYNTLVDDVNQMKKLISDAKTKQKVALSTRAADLKASKRLAKPKVTLPRVDHNGKRMLSFLGTFLITIAFGLLILEMIFFYLNMFTHWGTPLSVASVALFVVGMGIRIYLTLAGKN